MKLCMQCKKCGECGKPYSASSNYAEKCKDFEKRKITNFENIKKMGFDELADMLVVEIVGLQPCKLFQALPTEKTYIIKSTAVQDVKRWLESEVEE